MKKIILIFCILLPIKLYAQDNLKIYETKDFTGGMNTKIAKNLIQPNQCYLGKNILFDATQGFKTRQGIVEIDSFPVSGKTCQKLWNYKKSTGEEYLIAQIEDSLYYTQDKKHWTFIRRGITYQINPLQATVFDNKIWFVNGIDYLFYFDGSRYNGKLYNEVEVEFIKGKYILNHNNKLFIANTYDQPSRIYYCTEGQNPAMTKSWSALNYEDIGYEDGDIITGLASFRQILLIFKRYSLWGIFGYSYDMWEVSIINPNFGALYQESIYHDKGDIKFLSEKGLLSYDGSQIKDIDWNVENIFQNCNNLAEENRFWHHTSPGDWTLGKVVNLDISEELRLKDKTKQWSSQVEFDSGTHSNTAVSGNHVVLSTETFYIPHKKIPIIAPSYDVYLRLAPRGRTHQDGIHMENTSLTDWITRKGIGWSNYYSNWEKAYDQDYEDNVATKTYAYKATSVYCPDGTGGIALDFRTGLNYYVTVYPNEKIIINTNNEKVNSIRIKANSILDGTRCDYYNGGAFIENRFMDDACKNARIGFRLCATAKYFFTEGGEAEQNVYIKEVTYRYRDIHDSMLYYSPNTKTLFNFRVRYYNIINYFPDDVIVLNNNYNKRIKQVEIIIQSSNIGEWDKIKLTTKYTYYYIEFYMDNIINISPIYDISIYKPDEETIYKSTGVFKTEEYDFGQDIRFNTFTANTENCYEAFGTTITFKIRSKPDGGEWTPYYNVSNNNQIPCPDGRYVQVLSSFSTTMSTYTPILSNITIGAITSSGTWTSSIFRAEKLNKWKYFMVSDEKPEGTGISYAVRTGTGTPDYASWEWINSGDMLNYARHPSSHTYLQLKSTFSTTTGIKNPFLESVTIMYRPTEKDAVRPTSISIDDRYYIGISTGKKTTNNIVMVNDKFGGWTKITGWRPGAFCRFGYSYLMADNEQSKIYEIFADTTTDNGIPIESEWAKYYDFEIPDIDKNLKYIYLTGKAGDGTLNLKYTLESSTHTQTITQSQQGQGINNYRFAIQPQSSVRGFYEVISSTHPVEIHKISNYYTLETLR